MLCTHVAALASMLHRSSVPVQPRPASLRAGPIFLSFNPLDELREQFCPLTGGASSSSPSPPSSAAAPTLDSFLDQAEDFIIAQAGLPNTPLACQAAEAAIDTIARSVSQELSSLSVAVNASSSRSLLLGGELLAARVEATGVAASGLRASSLTLESAGIDFVVPAPFSTTLPNLRAPADVSFSVRLTQDDISRSPIIFGALQEILRELVRSGVSAAIGEALPRDRSGLVIKLVSVESPASDGRLVLVADAEATQSDGSVVSLNGMRVRCTPRVSLTDANLLVLDRPELVSSFEGFGAKVEVGLPFLRAAGVPLPPDVKLTRVSVADGAVLCEGTFTLRPVDYDALLAAAAAAAQDLAELQERTAATPRWEGGDAVSVDVEATTDDPPTPPTAGALPAGA